MSGAPTTGRDVVPRRKVGPASEAGLDDAVALGDGVAVVAPSGAGYGSSLPLVP